MHDAVEVDGALVIRGAGELGRAEVQAIAARAAAERFAGRRVVLDLARVTHLHYAGIALFRYVRGVRVAVASRYVRDLVNAGGAHVELFDDVESALRAA